MIDPDGLKLDSALTCVCRAVAGQDWDRESAVFQPITAVLAEALPCRTRHTVEGAGHVPHLGRPALYVETVGHFCGRLISDAPGDTLPRRAAELKWLLRQRADPLASVRGRAAFPLMASIQVSDRGH